MFKGLLKMMGLIFMYFFSGFMWMFKLIKMMFIKVLLIINNSYFFMIDKLKLVFSMFICLLSFIKELILFILMVMKDIYFMSKNSNIPYWIQFTFAGYFLALLANIHYDYVRLSGIDCFNWFMNHYFYKLTMLMLIYKYNFKFFYSWIFKIICIPYFFIIFCNFFSAIVVGIYIIFSVYMWGYVYV